MLHGIGWRVLMATMCDSMSQKGLMALMFVYICIGVMSSTLKLSHLFYIILIDVIDVFE
jgi:hypothetical protein